MIRHSLTLFIRSFRRYRSFFIINLIGLSTGLACALSIYLWVHDELSVDKFHKNDKHLFQVLTRYIDANGNVKTGDSTPGPLAKAMAEEMPEVEYAVTVRRWTSETGTVSVVGKHVKATEQYVSDDFFNVFSYIILQGNSRQPLQDKYAVMISDELALKMFNTTDDLIGKSIEWNKGELSGSYLIGGIFKTPPANSTDKFDLLFSYELYRDKKPRRNEWANGGTATYLVLRKGTPVQPFNQKISAYLESKNQVKEWSIFVTSYSDRYLYGTYENGVQAGGRIGYVKLFSVIAVLIMTIASINFMNLSTTRATTRLKEIGIKKTVGASRKALIFQYIGEAIVMTFFALAVAVLLIVLLLPQFNQITDKQLTLLDFDFGLIVVIFLITLVTGVISGSYPAFYLSGFKPSPVLKGKISTSIGEALARKGLVVFQFAISVVLIVAVIVVYKQVHLIQSKNLGYSKDQVILFSKEVKTNSTIEGFLHRLKSIPGVVNASTLGGDFTSLGNITSDLTWEGRKPDVMLDFGEVGVGYDLTETLGIKLKEGRSFSRSYGSDSTKIIFNSAAVTAMGLKDPVGKTVTLWGQEREIIGVVNDFHTESLYEQLKPCFLLLSPYVNNIAVKIKAGNENETLRRIQDLHETFNPETPFEFQFMDQAYNTMYASENRIHILSRYFAGLAIIISCLGLFGLTSFTAERRRKEIGIRKVLGSGTASIVNLVVGEFMRMVLISIGLSLPVSYLIANGWLSKFAYRIDLELWYFAIAGLAAFVIALVTVVLQILKVARVNPVHCLKEE